MNPASPVVAGLESYETIFGEKQPEYVALPALRGAAPEHAVMSRWELTKEEREMIANGADIFVSIWTFGGLYPPTHVRVMNKNTDATIIKAEMRLDEEVNGRLPRRRKT
jgi:hypothetical protein